MKNAEMIFIIISVIMVSISAGLALLLYKKTSGEGEGGGENTSEGGDTKNPNANFGKTDKDGQTVNGLMFSMDSGIVIPEENKTPFEYRDDKLYYRLMPEYKSDVLCGRSSDADIIIASDHMVSRRHFRLMYYDNNWTIKDMESTNGTFVNDTRVLEAVLHPEDKIRIGNTIIIAKSLL